MVTEEKHQEFVGSRAREMDKLLVSLAIEKALISTGKKTLDKVENRLNAKYGLFFRDCLEHPEYLKDVLEEIFGNSNESVILSIKDSLRESENNSAISDFLVKISR